MRTVRVGTVFGWGPAGLRDGLVRVAVPSWTNEGSLRSAVRRGIVALHGPQSPSDARCGVGFRFISRAKSGGGWVVLGRASVVG